MRLVSSVVSGSSETCTVSWPTAGADKLGFEFNARIAKPSVFSSGSSLDPGRVPTVTR